ncbi:Cell wall-associated polypeptide CWBP200 [uncultured Clostridium sp.]|nr:Cell wall-associated polypeptide CWBP200 [uncultured Clostridium sp.]
MYKTEEGVNTLESTTDYTYDQANQLSTTHQTFEDDGQDDITTGNLYNGNGQRIRLTWNGSLYQKYYYMGSALFFTTDANNLRDSENILSPGGSIVASRRQDSSDANKYYFYHTDIRGSVTNIVGTKDNAIYLAQGYNYDNFGKEEELKSESSFKNDVTFTGAVSDSMTGLYYMNARHYDPDTGRFLQQDTYKGSAAVPWTQHLYAYTGNNPVNMVDPTGHSASMYDQYPDSSYSGIYVKPWEPTMSDQYGPNNCGAYVPPPSSDMQNQYNDPWDAGIYQPSMPSVYSNGLSVSYQPPALEYASPGMKMPSWVTGLENGIMIITVGTVLTGLTGGSWVPVAISGIKGGFVYGGYGAALGGGTELINSGGSWDKVPEAMSDGFGTMFPGGAFNGTVDGMISTSMRNDATVNDLIKKSTPGRATKGKSTQYNSMGGYNQALSDFYSLNPTNIRKSGNTIIGDLSDGTTVNVRSHSTQGSATVDVFNPVNRTHTKFRYK